MGVSKWIKYTIKSILAALLRQSEEQIKRQIDCHDVISFDVFDTLIERKCGRPTNVFRIMEEQVDEKDFVRRRVEADRNARIRSSKEEVTLDEVYECFAGLSLEKKDLYKAIELECEKSHATSKTIGKSLFEYAKENGKRVLVISDMYLPETFIGCLLEGNGYQGFEKLYVSSEHGLRKKTGRLYQYVEGDLKIDVKTWLHIGDNPITDFFGAKKMSIASSIV